MSSRRTWTLAGALVLVLLVAALAAAATVAYFAYDRQSNRVEQLQSRDAKIERDHVAIGAKFAEQSAELEEAVTAVSTAYGRGFRAGRKAQRLPRAFARLWLSVQRGYRVPMGIPAGLRGGLLAVRQSKNGYTVRWRGVALFASRRTRLSDWTAQAWPGSRRNVRVGRRTVRRLVGPFGVVYAWREQDKTYAVAALPRRERQVPRLIRTLK